MISPFWVKRRHQPRDHLILCTPFRICAQL